MNQKNLLVVPIDDELLEEIFKQKNKEEIMSTKQGKSTYYLMEPITQKNWKIRENVRIFGNGLLWLDPYGEELSRDHIYRTQDIELNTSTKRVTVAGEKVHFGDVEILLLRCLLHAAHAVVSRDYLLTILENWTQHEVQDNTLTVHISRIKKKLGLYEGKERIETRHTWGYEWLADVERD